MARSWPLRPLDGSLDRHDDRQPSCNKNNTGDKSPAIFPDFQCPVIDRAVSIYLDSLLDHWKFPHGRGLFLFEQCHHEYCSNSFFYLVRNQIRSRPKGSCK
jgi:hypothetical protein